MIMHGFDLQTNDSGLASYAAGQVDQSLSWKVDGCSYIRFSEVGDRRNFAELLLNFSLVGQDVKWLQTITPLPILVKGVLTAEDGM